MTTAIETKKEPMREGLVADQVSVQFGGVKALTDVSIHVRPGRGIDAIIGPNGAGKTTLFNVLTGVVEPTRGRIFVHGQEITGMRQDRIFQRGVSRTFQGVRLFEHLTVEQNVELAARSVRGRDERSQGRLTPAWLNSSEARARAHRALEQTELPASVRSRFPSQLTLWESRMVEIARAISSEPAVLLLDEPAAGLNPVEKTRLRELLSKLSIGLDCHLVVVEHDMNLVMSIAEKVWVLNFGALLAYGSPAQIQTDPRVLEAYLGSPEEQTP
jgi:branched-chain amino acid transport system ATP-binding protein